MVEQAFQDGFTDAMKVYKTDIDTKVGIDRTQMSYRCCGALSYEDWFETSWVDVEYLDKFDREISRQVFQLSPLLFNSCIDVKC